MPESSRLQIAERHVGDVTVLGLTGEMLLSHDATVALGAVLGGADLVRFYLSDDYQRLRDYLTAAPQTN